MKIKSVIVLLLAAASFCSCDDGNQKNSAALPLVEDILSNHEGCEYQMLNSMRKPNPQNEVFILGSHSSVWSLSNLLSDADNFDNIDGYESKDWLPDFAGESFCVIADSLGRDYNYYVNNGQSDSLREICVRYCLSALDTVSHLSIYDERGLGIKQAAKIIIIADPQLSAYGKYDVDTLFKASGCGILTLSPVDMAFENICADVSAPMNIGVVCSPENANSEMYRKILDRYAFNGSRVHAISVTNKQIASLQEFLASYIASGNTTPLDALLVDDKEVSVSGLEKSLGEIRSLMFEDSKTYGEFINPKFFILRTDDIVAKGLFRLMRNKDLFTHDISLPKIIEYITVPVSDSNQPYMLISTNVQN